jgi:hypothetical protein
MKEALGDSAAAVRRSNSRWYPPPFAYPVRIAQMGVAATDDAGQLPY